MRLHKNKYTKIFFILSLLFALVSLPYSAAISQGRLERTATARVVNDENGLIMLKGFQNKSYDLSGNYYSFGTITNNSNRIMKLTVTIQPDFNILHLFSRFGIKIGAEEIEFRYGASSPRQISLILSPGQVMEVKASLIQNILSTLTVDFQFTATDAAGSYTIRLSNTPRSPRRIHCY